MMLFKRLLVALALLFPSALALAQGTQFPAGTVWGNNTAAVRPGQVSTLTALFDRAFGSTSGTILERAGAWGLTSTPTLGANGGTGGQLTLKGSTSGAAAIRVAAAAGTGTIFQLPPDNGTNTYVLQTNGSGVTSWVAQASGSGTILIASGTSALGTSAIASAACATVVTTAATGVATTDVITAGFNGDPTGVTGYVASTSGMLTIVVYPSANNVNFKVCNNTGASITPGAITLNWRVVR